MNNYAKTIVALLTNAETVASLYPNIHWSQAVAAAIGTFLVYFVPNGTPALTPVVPPKVIP